MKPLETFLAGLALLLGAACGGGSDASSDTPRVAFVSNGVDPFWTLAEAGARAAAAEFGVQVDVRMPAAGTVEEQKRIVEDLLARGVDGIAISPIDGVNQKDMIDEACALTHVITHDSDAPTTRRLCYVGTDNYAAGRACGKLVKEAMPEGGSVVIFIGRLEQDNAKKRRQGVIDELLDRPDDPSRFDPVDEAIVGERYTILDTRTDGFDRARAKSNAEDALALHPDLGAMVGLFAYNVPAILEALADADKLGQVQVGSFDEDDRALQGVVDGWIQGTVTQQPYEYGYQSVRILAALARGDRSVLPESGYLPVDVNVVRASDVPAFRADIERMLSSLR